MKKSAMALALSAALVGNAFATEGGMPKGVPHLDHVFLIMMENHGYSQIMNNPNAPFINKLAQSANLATNYFAVGHPSLTNYLEVVGGSNFGVQSDNSPDWHNATCVTNLQSNVPNTDVPASPNICPIGGVGMDAATPAVDTVNEVSHPGDIILNIDGVQAIPAAFTTGKTIADQLAAYGLRWKSYQESLPPAGADRVNSSDGFFTNNTDFSTITPTLTPPLTQGDVVSLYAAKHNPFAYFRSTQEGDNAGNSLKNSVGFDGAHGLFADLHAGTVPAFSFIAPNQCNDQHGRGNAGAFCNYDPVSDGSQSGLNPALIIRGDQTVETLVGAIKSSPVWKEGHNAIIVMWDENDYSIKPNTNQVMVIVDTNYGKHKVQSNVRYNHFSVLKTLEAGFELPCLNHACDKDVPVMSDLFARH
jgi:hypothetical protein